MGDRYECVQEPTDSWLIWDLLKDVPAMADSRLLMGLTASEAWWLCVSLNDDHREKADIRTLVSGTSERAG